ncbi:hypothetical protein J6590_017524 [Homalodisca vitripennis]|nr:hypothetical protein J6590_017524 [Homalodisca vitripennis]
MAVETAVDSNLKVGPLTDAKTIDETAVDSNLKVGPLTDAKTIDTLRPTMQKAIVKVHEIPVDSNHTLKSLTDAEINDVLRFGNHSTFPVGNVRKKAVHHSVTDISPYIDNGHE